MEFDRALKNVARAGAAQFSDEIKWRNVTMLAGFSIALFSIYSLQYPLPEVYIRQEFNRIRVPRCLPFDRIANRFCLGAESYHCPLVTSVSLLHRLTPNHDLIRTANQGSGVGCKCNSPAKAGTDTSNDDADTKPCCIVLDIEGTTTPISFVTDVLFPYARDNVGRHLYETYETQETREDIKLLRSQVESDLEQGVTGAIPIPSEDSGKDEVVSALVTNVEAMIKADRKITALKQLQGHIWRTGFLNNELEGVVYEDVPEALENWHKSGVKVYIYSSGSRLAQRLIFGKTAYGDLRKYLSGFFDTSIGNKRETRSYNEIYESVGVDKPSDILFITDVYQEAVAAKAAGLKVIISIRPGNGPLPQNHEFRTISSFLDI